MTVPWGPIQGDPLGLLSLLELKNRGKNPEYLAETVVPTIDVGPAYLLRNRTVLSGSATFSPPSGYASIFGLTAGDLRFPIPDGEVWYVGRVAAQFAFTTGDVVNGVYGGLYGGNGSSENLFWGLNNIASWTAVGANAALAISEHFGKLLPAGTVWGAVLGDCTSPNLISFTMWAEVTRLKI